MKNILTLAVVALFTLQSFAQKSPGLKVGLGLPIVFGAEPEIKSVSGHHKITGYPTFAIEKPIPIEVKRRNKFSINPGLAYHLFHEDIKQVGVSPATGGTNLSNPEQNLYQHSVNVYTKGLIQTALGHKRKEGIAYLGVIAGFHLWTRTIGERISNNPQLPENKPIKINDKGDRFYNGVYFGPVIGFQPPAKFTNTIKPSFEAAFYPGIINRGDDKASVIQVTVLLGIRQR